MTTSISVQSEKRPVRVLILGGSYGGLSATMNFLDLADGKAPRYGWEHPLPGHQSSVEVTIVDERDGFFHLIGSPLALADEDYAARAWIDFCDIPALHDSRVRVKHGSVRGVDCGTRVATMLAHGSEKSVELQYDYLVAATGLRRSWPTVPQALSEGEYMAEMKPHIDKMRAAEHGVAVIGGGAVGVEMAAELKTVSPETRVVLINSRERLLSAEPLPDEFKDQSLVMLRKGGVETMMSKRMQAVASDSEMKTVTFTDGTELRVSEVINAVSAPKPTTTYLPNEVMTSEGEVEVAANLAFKSSVPKSAYHYAIGDIVARPGIIKRCGGAMHEGHHAAYNMHQHMLADQGLISKPVYKEMANHGPSIGLALGKEAIGYSSETGIMAGEETLGDLFGDDLALRYCYDHMGLDRKRGCSDVAIEPLGEPESAPGKVVQSIPVVSAEA